MEFHFRLMVSGWNLRTLEPSVSGLLNYLSRKVATLDCCALCCLLCGANDVHMTTMIMIGITIIVQQQLFVFVFHLLLISCFGGGRCQKVRPPHRWPGGMS